MLVIVDKNSPIPLYYQVKEDIINKIKKDDLKVGDKIAGEHELKDIYGVSQITIRKALSELVNEGYLYRVQGKGTYVAERKVNRLLNLMSFTEEMRQRGFEPGVKLLEVEMIRDPLKAEQLEVSRNSNILKVKRLRLADGIPVALQTSYLSESILEIDDVKDFEKKKSLYKILTSKGVVPYKAKEQYNVLKMDDKKICNMLNIKKGDAVFWVKRRTYTEDDKLFEYAESILRGDKYAIEVELNN